jgi:hypothetical protein
MPNTARQPTGVVTTPTQSVRPVGSLTSGRSCGPMRKPVVARNAGPSAGIYWKSTGGA